MSCRIEIVTRDGVQFDFPCEPDADLLSAAAAADLTLPSQCRRGSCGACHASVTEGDYTLGDHSRDALPPGEADAILLCRTLPRSDLRIVVPYDSAKVLRQPVPVRSARIVALEPLAMDTVRLRLRVERDDAFGSAVEFEAGQFAELEVPALGVRRPYSLANTSNWDGRLEFLIRLQPHGAFSDWLRTQAKPDDTLIVHGPQGGFGLIAGSVRPRWFVAGGTGLAPALSMLRRMVAFQECEDTHLFFGVTHERDLFMLDEIDRLRAALAQLQVTLCVWEAGSDWRGFRGTPVDALRVALAQADQPPDLYVCGPPALVNAAHQAAIAARLPAAQFVSERFTLQATGSGMA